MGEAKVRAERARVGEIEVEYAEAGSGDRPFVLVHGFTGSRDDFVDVLPALGEHGRTLTPDLRGHGGSSNPGDGYTLEAMGEDLGGFLDAVGIETCDLLGHSLGGMISLRFVLANPERVRSLVLMNTSPRALELGPARAIFEQGAKLARAKGMATLWSLIKDAPRTDLRPAELARIEREGDGRYRERIERKLLAMDPEAFAQLGEKLGGQTPVDERLAEISCPSTVIVGEQDAPFLQPSKDMAAGIRGAALEIIPEAAHSPQFENEADWLRAIRGHLDRARN